MQPINDRALTVMYSSPLRRSGVLTLLAALVAGSACSSKPSAKAETPRGDSTATAAGEVAKDSAGGTASAGDVAPASDPTANSRMFGSADTSNIKLKDGRTKADNSSFIAAVKAGARAMTKWPTHPAASGALLPANRIVAYYG